MFLTLILLYHQYCFLKIINHFLFHHLHDLMNFTKILNMIYYFYAILYYLPKEMDLYLILISIVFYLFDINFLFILITPLSIFFIMINFLLIAIFINITPYFLILIHNFLFILNYLI